MIVAATVPFLLILIIIVVIFIAVNKIKKASFFLKLNLKWLLGVYGTMLLISVALYYVIPIEKPFDKVDISKQELTKADKASRQLTMAASEGKQIDKENIDGVQIKNQWNFTFKGKQLKIIADEQYGPVFRLVERKDVNDDKVEVTQYNTRTIIDNLDLTDDIGPFTLEFAEDQLTIRDPNVQDIHVGRFEKEFTISQFTEENSINPFSDQQHVWGENVLYIRVPKDVDVKGEVQFVAE